MISDLTGYFLIMAATIAPALRDTAFSREKINRNFWKWTLIAVFAEIMIFGVLEILAISIVRLVNSN